MLSGTSAVVGCWAEMRETSRTPPKRPETRTCELDKGRTSNKASTFGNRRISLNVERDTSICADGKDLEVDKDGRRMRSSLALQLHDYSVNKNHNVSTAGSSQGTSTLLKMGCHNKYEQSFVEKEDKNQRTAHWETTDDGDDEGNKESDDDGEVGLHQPKSSIHRADAISDIFQHR